MSYFKLAAGAAGVLFVLALAWFVKFTFEKNGKLEEEAKQRDAVIAQQETNIKTLQGQMADQQKTLDALAKMYDQHSAAIAANAKKADDRANYIAKTYAGASNVTKSVLDSDLPEFRCVFDGSCETVAVPSPAVPSAKH